MPTLRQVLAVATSGGKDSTALLHAVLRQAKAAGVQVWALHVHHGLQPSADDWLRHLQRQCSRWARQGWPVSFAFERLTERPGPGVSIEAWARQARYATLARMAKAHGARAVLLAHHRSDQAETVLLQALRGAGPAGLAAMPMARQQDGVLWLRPWLRQPRVAIESYIQRWRLSHIDDESNLDPKFDRNRLRLKVTPALSREFPQAEQSLCDLAQQAACASAFIDEMSEGLLASMQRDDGLDAAAWRRLSTAQRHWVMRRWLMGQTLQGITHALLHRLVHEAVLGDVGRWPLGGQSELRLYRHRFTVSVAASATPPCSLAMNDGKGLDWASAAEFGRLSLPEWGGYLELVAAPSQGLTLGQLQGACLRVRGGGEQFQRAARTPPRALKKQFQAMGVPAWKRQGPLLWQGDALLFVPGLGIDARCWADDGQPQYLLYWHPQDVAPTA